MITRRFGPQMARGGPPTVAPRDAAADIAAAEAAFAAITEAATSAATLIVRRRITPQAPPGDPTDFTFPGAQSFPMPNVWVEETHHDGVVITEHPVERGAPVTDHAFAKPPELTLRLGWGGGGVTLDMAIAAYTQILLLKDDRVLLDVHTGKRFYPNMLISDLTVSTDQTTEYVVLATMQCRQLILVDTSSFAYNSNTQNQTNPSSTAQQTDNGPVPLAPGSNFNFNEAGFPEHFGAPGSA